MSGLAGSVPALPGNALPVFIGVTNDGDIALTDIDGNFDYSNLEVWGTAGHGVDCSGLDTGSGLGQCISNIQNSLFNGANMTPQNGVNANVDFDGFLADLDASKRSPMQTLLKLPPAKGARTRIKGPSGTSVVTVVGLMLLAAV